MNSRIILAAVVSVAAIVSTGGCAVARDQQTAGAFIDDTGITTRVKAKHAEDKTVSATSISVETLNGVVQLSGFAKTAEERNQAEVIARNTSGVKSVRNSIIVRP